MADNNIVIIDGVRRKLTDAEFETEFGFKVDTPRDGEKLFDGRYEHLSFNSSSFNTATGHPTSDSPAADVNTGDTIFSISGSV